MIRILTATIHTLPMRTRLPFRYGIVTLREIEHCFVRVHALIDGVESVGVAADGLAPKWFTKDPATSIESDLAAMQTMIAAACNAALACGEAASVFDMWRRLHAATPAQPPEVPALLTSFGASLIERALIDAFCRAKGMTFAAALRSNVLGIQLDALHPELAGSQPRDWLPTQPLRRIVLRHTVGLLDPLSTAQEGDALDDGLPVTLRDCIQAYGLTHFKIKLSGDLACDLTRLSEAAHVIQTYCHDYAFTLDGNEQFTSVPQFCDAWRAIVAAPGLTEFMRRLLFVEQPLHRAVALTNASAAALNNWRDRPALIIDESDGELDSVRLALASGYRGASHKNCKGVFKGVANACLIAKRGAPLFMSGEDLANVGPVALTQDLAVMAALGIQHVERNGHHYFQGLAAFPEALQARILERHGDLFQRHERGFATLRARAGGLDVSSVVDASFGYDGAIPLEDCMQALGAPSA